MKKNEFGIWTIPATMGAVRLAGAEGLKPAHYDAIEREAIRRSGSRKHAEITIDDVVKIKHEIENFESAICAQCGLFHSAPACEGVR